MDTAKDGSPEDNPVWRSELLASPQEDAAPVKFRGSVVSGAPGVDAGVIPRPSDATVIYEKAVEPVRSACPYCDSDDHLDAGRCGKYLKATMLEQTAQTAALQSIRRSLLFFVVLTVIGIVIALFGSATNWRF